MVDLLSGQMQLYFGTMPGVMPHVKSGRLRPVAVTSEKRSQTLPELPTIAETGVAGYEASTWYGLHAPALTPRPIVTRLHAEVVKILAVREMHERLVSQGFEPVGNTPEQFAAYIRAEIAKWGKVIREADIKAE